MVSRYQKTPFSIDLLYVLRHPVDSLLTIPSALKNRDLYSIKRNIQGTLSWKLGLALYRAVMESNHPSPNVVEVGVYQGLSSTYLACACKKRGKRVKSFDWFQGLDHPDRELDGGFTQGSYKSDPEIFDNNLKSRGLRDVVDLTIGDARNTLLPVIKNDGFSVAFLDVDMYDITRDMLNQLKLVITGGETIIIHDYRSPGIIKAAAEFIDFYSGRAKFAVIDKRNEFPAIKIRISV